MDTGKERCGSLARERAGLGVLLAERLQRVRLRTWFLPVIWVMRLNSLQLPMPLERVALPRLVVVQRQAALGPSVLQPLQRRDRVRLAVLLGPLVFVLVVQVKDVSSRGQRLLLPRPRVVALSSISPSVLRRVSRDRRLVRSV